MRVLIALVISATLFAADPKLTPEMQVVVNHISADSLRGHLSFIASDLLQGRATPSPGLDLAAEYIAAQFRRAGLKPAGDDGYFQTATLRVREPNWQGFHMALAAGNKAIELSRDDVYVSTASALDFEDVRVVVADSYTTPESVKGKVIFASNPRIAGRFRGSDAALVLLPADDRGPDLPPGPQVSDPESSRRTIASATISRTDALDLLAHSKEVRLTFHMEAPIERSVKVRNVAGLLRGSDPVLRDSYVMLTAHYDHLGTRASGPDRIFNGANDDGSGTVSVMEIAGAMAALDPRPKRSILFVTFFGEERGLLGSRYYGRHPLVPLEKTIADINLEQVGRTDASNGPQVGTASLTGYDFSDVPRIVAQAGRLVGVKVYKDDQASDPFFSRSDNQALADIGVPAHTLCVAFDYRDYHSVSDEWDKIDYANMAEVDDAVGLAMLHLASDAAPPHWNDAVPAARRYADAAKKLHSNSR